MMLKRAALVFLSLSLLSRAGHAQPDLVLVDIKSVDPSIVVDLRYGGTNNIAKRPLYPPGTRALVRPETAERLAIAQAFLRKRLRGLKIWDAYRPRNVQVELWRAAKMNGYVADPDTTNGSLHAWGVAVDATLVDGRNQPVKMPTDFDDFTPAAMWRYLGPDPYIQSNLRLLQSAMAEAGFYGLRAEWWHFIVADWKNYVPDPNQIFTSRRHPVPEKL